MTAPAGFTPRPYPDIVRDLLTTLTGGTVRETAIVPPGDVVLLDTLADRPIRRVSHLQGVVAVERPVRDANGGVVLDVAGNPEMETAELPFRFTDTDFEVVATGAAGDRLDAIRFRPTGRRPPTGSTVTVNYYPDQTRPVPLTDLNVGSVTRTLLESVARELALEELLLERVYRSAFLDTAEGTNLEKVVALVGVRRRPTGVATARVRFSRAAGSTGRITIPTGTVVADDEGHRYATTAPLILESGEPSREVLTAAASRSTPAVGAGALDRLEVLVAGVGTVVNDAPAAPAAAPESDDALRVRASSALAVAARGTLDALEFGVRSLSDDIRHVTVVEFPNGVPGEVRVDIVYAREDEALRAAVRERIEDLRPAGIRVVDAAAGQAPVSVTVSLLLAGGGLPADELVALQTQLEDRAVTHLRSLPAGAPVRQAQLVAAVLADPRIADVSFELDLGGSPSASVTAPPGTVLDPVRPFTYEVATETAAPAAAVLLDALVPVHLVAGVAATEAERVLRAAAGSYAAGVRPGATVTVDAFLAAVRDDTRYQVVRNATALTVEASGRFLQLTDGAGAYPVGPSETVTLRELGLDVREGAV